MSLSNVYHNEPHSLTHTISLSTYIYTPTYLQMFCGLLFMSALFFALGFFVGIPTIAIRPQKFALCFTLGSLAFMASFGILKGPVAHLQSMLTAERLPFTTIYIGSMLMTLYLTFNFGGINGYLLVMASCGVQMLSLLWYLISFLPGGSAGLQIVLSAIMRILSPIFVLCAKAHAVCMGYCIRYLMGGGSSSSSSGNS